MFNAGPVWAAGTMSGTSLDGVDAALLLSDGERIIDFGRSDYRSYTQAERVVLHDALGCWPHEEGVAQAAAVVELAHAEILGGLSEASVIGFHGQTLAHDPRAGRTHQAGDGRILAGALDRCVVWDFRSEDVAQGGQGAPLAPFFHFACAQWAKLDAPVVFANLGGVGNVTWVDPTASRPDVPGAVLAFDTGPANAPLNDLMRQRFGLERDEGGRLAAQGHADAGIVAQFLDHAYFHQTPPKSLDRNDFGYLLHDVAGLGDADAAATLTACAAAAVAQAAVHYPRPPCAIYVCGGGRLNTQMMAQLARRVDCAVHPVEDLGLDGDMLEAQAFAFLALRVARGLPTSAPGTTGVRHPVTGGIISQPG
ncbi:anhydro-N-acetylmuramic acid kinase [Rhodobacteraceae bacterium]|nr:anhydro-N-acetylmuramic acid kinase [Paracoccaceae bacterium]